MIEPQRVSKALPTVFANTQAIIPGGEKTTKAAQGAADQMEKAAGYLRDHDVSSMGEDVVELVKSHPKESIVVALAAGLLLGRALRS